MIGCYTDVEPGFVGIVVTKFGSGRGVDHHPQVGRVYAGYGQEVVVFPITRQNVVWTKDIGEGNPTDESLTFAASGGVSVNADVGITYRVDPNHAADLYIMYHFTEMKQFSDGELRNVVRDALAHAACNMQVQDLLGNGRNTLLETAKADIIARLGPRGILVDNLTFVNAPRFPPNVQQAINASMEANQRLAQAEAQARSATATAEGTARAAEAEARGAANSLMIRTQADARNRILMASAEAQANEIIELSTTARVLRYRAIQRWNGVLPTVQGGSQNILALDVPPAEAQDGSRHVRLLQLMNAIPSDTTTPTATPSAPVTAHPSH